MNYFRKNMQKVQRVYFLRNEENSKMRPDRPRSLMGIMQNRAFSLSLLSQERKLALITKRTRLNFLNMHDNLSKYEFKIHT